MADKHGLVVYDRDIPPLKFAAERLETVLAGMQQPPQVELYAAPQQQWPCDAGPQGYSVYAENGRVVVAGADEAGGMYGGLDVAEHFALGGGIESLRGGVRDVFIQNRGIKLNIPLDARTPSYTDGGDSAQQNLANMWDMDFWHGFLDRMALNKYNALSLWSLSPFPSLVRTPGFPDAALDDVMRAAAPPRGTLRGWEFYTARQAESLVTVKRLSMAEKIAFWREVTACARSRCICIYLFVWNIYTYSAQDAGYGITDDPDNRITRDYIRRSVEAMVETYPLLAGIGVTAGENMRREWATDVREDVAWVMDVYGRGIMAALEKEPEREFTLIHRNHMCSTAQMEKVFRDFPHPLEWSFKYSQAHMYSSVKPAFGNNFFAGLSQGRKTWLTLRDDDFYMLRWGDFAFAKDYLQNIPRGVVKGFFHGSDGIVRGLDYASRSENGAYFFDRHRYDFALWGRLAYDITQPEEYFRKLTAKWLGAESPALYEAMRHASRAIPLVQRVYWNDYDFQWYPEACCGYIEEEDRLFFHDLNALAAGCACPGAGYLSVAEYCESVRDGKPPEGVTPVEAAGEIRRECITALSLLDSAAPYSGEAAELAEDIRAMAELGLYYADKLEAAAGLGLWRASGDERQRETAEAKATEALGHWLAYSSSMAKRYRPQRLSRLRHVVSPEMFDAAAETDILIAREG